MKRPVSLAATSLHTKAIPDASLSTRVMTNLLCACSNSFSKGTISS